MAHRTAEQTQPADTAPPDIATMRHTVNRLLDPDAVSDALPPGPDEL